MLHLAPATLTITHVLLFKRDTRAATGWIMACLFIPYLGPIVYYLFGINRVRLRAQTLKQQLAGDHIKQALAVRPEHSPSRPQQLAGFLVSGSDITEGNHVKALYNGDQAYPQMLAAIDAARHRILLASYIFKPDRAGQSFVDRLAAAVARGVDVRVLIDGVGEHYSFRRISTVLKKRGVRVVRFLPPRLIPPSIYINLRNHRKLLVVDNHIAFAGGMNISEDNCEYATRKKRIADIHFKFMGPIVPALADLFEQDWRYTRARPRQALADPPMRATGEQGDAGCRLIADGPDQQIDALELTLAAVVSTASHSILIITPYFLPSRELISALMSASMRGVRVSVVLPEKNNLPYMNWASRSSLIELSQWGINIYYQPPPFSHTKLLCIDQGYCFVGSANLDPRSLRLNFELGVEVFSESVNAELRKHANDLINRSRLMSYQQLSDRSILVRLRDAIAALMTPYL
ncbi:phospholipase D-like domain-containing protein [Marinobacter sp. X15-166B]|uniref:phospholipase D-like domain-containing protein n=1 Tax=Marinobacter sp. X15-166B TaxID=1897620 RepID=UPI00114CA5D6|nr:phospholipase D-like domain-containing protein [Marinobacter sp. X15-166B]